MPLNLIKEYNALLEIMHLSVPQRTDSLKKIFLRDIEENEGLNFQGKIIRPIKKDDGIPRLQTLFHHLTTEVKEEERADGKKYKKRIFQKERSERLHWIKYHIEERKKTNIEIFSIEERDTMKRTDIIRTYIYDVTEKYVIVLEPQKSKMDYYLLTAYYLNKEYGVKMMKKKMKKRLDVIY